MSATTFSYAQAAKGRAPAQASSPAPAADSQTKDDASSVTTAPDASAKTFSTTSEVSESVKSSQIDADLGSKKGGDEPMSVPLKDDTTMSRDTTKANSQTTNDKPARQSGRSSEATDSKKSRKGKKGRNSDKDVESEQTAPEPEKEVVPVKLTEATPPSVNIWEQRAAAAKAKQPSSASSNAAAESRSKPAIEVSTKAAQNADIQAAETLRSSTKSSEAPRTSADQSGRKPRGHRVNEKGEQAPIPSSAVEDASSWPTPDTVAAEDGKRKTTVEPEVKDKKDDGVKTARPKGWQKMEINPTVVFSTPLPPRNGPKPPRAGGQAGRGSGRGHASSVSISSEKVQAAAGDAPASKEGGAESQGKSREELRAPFAPSEKSKKFSADQTAQRKQSVASGARGSGDFPAAKNEGSKPSAGNESTKKDGFANHREPKPRRGGAHTNGRGAHNGQQPFMSNGNGAARGSTHSPPSFGSGFSQNQYGGPAPRGRGGRPASLSNGYKGPLNGMGKMHPQQTHQAAPEFNQFANFGPANFPPQPVQSHDYVLLRHQALGRQLEYYFSDENLGTDVFLRRQMDAEGFVAFDVVANFNRIRHISNGDENAVRAAIHDCPSIEFIIGDGKELMRRRGDWQKFIIDGESTTRNPGPTKSVPHPRNAPGNAFYQPMPYPPYNPISPQFGQAYPGDMHPGYMNRHQFSGNGPHINGHGAFDNSSLNVAAPEFSPVTAIPNGFPGAFAHSEWTEQAMEDILMAAQTVTDQQCASLHVVAQGQDTKKAPNGTTAEDASEAKTNGVHVEPEPSIPDEDIRSPAYRAKNGHSSQVSDTNNNETYVELRERAIAQRQAANPGDSPASMKVLYKFWSHYLTENFNVSMYKEFKQIALEDATAKIPSKFGHANLVQCYKSLLSMNSKVGEIWGLGHPVYGVLESHYRTVQETVNGNEAQV